VEDSKRVIGAVALLISLALGCSDAQRLSPTGPTVMTQPTPTVASPAAVVRTEQWQLDLTVRDVAGAECDEAIGTTRRQDLWMDVHDDGTIALHYDHRPGQTGHAADWTGWTLDQAFEGSGAAYEGMPCSGADEEPSGAPSTLTGYFSADRHTFTGLEIRRYMGRADGEIVYYLEWKAERLQ